jgi:hypothetical protein
MGLFDDVLYDGKNYQTKDLDSGLNHYEVREGRLCQRFGRWVKPAPKAGATEAEATALVWEHERYDDINHHGLVYIYGGEAEELYLRFTDGTLQEVMDARTHEILYRHQPPMPKLNVLQRMVQAVKAVFALPPVPEEHTPAQTNLTPQEVTLLLVGSLKHVKQSDNGFWLMPVVYRVVQNNVKQMNSEHLLMVERELADINHKDLADAVATTVRCEQKARAGG